MKVICTEDICGSIGNTSYKWPRAKNEHLSSPRALPRSFLGLALASSNTTCEPSEVASY